VAQSSITGNGTGWQATNGAQVQIYGNNNVGGNTSDGTANTMIALQEARKRPTLGDKDTRQDVV
jgi:hypothetical protein